MKTQLTDEDRAAMKAAYDNRRGGSQIPFSVQMAIARRQSWLAHIEMIDNLSSQLDKRPIGAKM